MTSIVRCQHIRVSAEQIETGLPARALLLQGRSESLCVIGHHSIECSLRLISRHPVANHALTQRLPGTLQAAPCRNLEDSSLMSLLKLEKRCAPFLFWCQIELPLETYQSRRSNSANQVLCRSAGDDGVVDVPFVPKHAAAEGWHFIARVTPSRAHLGARCVSTRESGTTEPAAPHSHFHCDTSESLQRSPGGAAG